MNQTKTASFIEAIFNVLIGYGVALISQILIFPIFGIEVSLSANFGIAAWFTPISIIRSYAIRRWFNAALHTAALRLAISINKRCTSEENPCDHRKYCQGCGMFLFWTSNYKARKIGESFWCPRCGKEDGVL